MILRQRKIDDNELIELWKQGKNQKQIAKVLGVSNVAIHKRLKKLLPLIMPLPESVKKLTPKEQKFCHLVAQGESRTNAVMQTYEVSSRRSAKALQNELMKKDWFNKGRLKGVKIGAEWHISEENLRKFLNAEEGGETKKERGKRQLRSLKKTKKERSD